MGARGKEGEQEGGERRVRGRRKERGKGRVGGRGHLSPRMFRVN